MTPEVLPPLEPQPTEPAPPPKKRKSKADLSLALVQKYAAANHMCAQLILRDVPRYGGPDSLMVRWAQMIVRGYTPMPADWRLAA